ncbi:MAG TPA: ribonuclease P [archaeon]|nr:ribonuclease P [archaeon]
MSRQKQKEGVQQTAKRRVAGLVKMAVKEKNPVRARRYGELARAVGMRNRVRLGKEKQLFCKKCGAPPSKVGVRIKDGCRVLTCRECGHVRKLPVRREARRESKQDL